MANTLTLLGALFATQNLTLEDATLLAEFCQQVDKEPETLESAIDLALNYFNEDPDIEAAKVAAAHAGTENHDPDTCSECGEELMDAVDLEQAIDLWAAIRNVTDKYRFDQERQEPRDIEEC